MNGYHNNPDAILKAFAQDWFRTGDLGRLDREGFLYIAGRSSDVFISGGSNVYAREVEELLQTYDGVYDVAILGMPHPKWGEVGVAVIVCKQGKQSLSDETVQHLEGRLARYIRLAGDLLRCEAVRPRSVYAQSNGVMV